MAIMSFACGGSGAPSTPTPAPTPAPAPPPPPIPTTAAITGHVTATNGGQPLAGVSIALGTTTVTSDGSGAFASTLPFGTLRVTLSSAAILPRSVTAAVNRARDLPLDAVALSGGFDQNYYRQLVRNTLDAP